MEQTKEPSKKQNKKKQLKKPDLRAVRSWMHSASCKCVLLTAGAFLIILMLFFCVCTPRKYDLRVGTIAHVTIDATKDVVDEVTTEEKRNAAADTVEPKYNVFQQGVKEEVMSSLENCFQELRTLQQYGVTLRSSDDGGTVRNFSEDEIDYAYTLVNTLTLTRSQVITLLRVDTEAFEEMVSLVTVAVENSMNASVREGQVSQAINTVLQIVGYKLDISLTQNIVPTVLRACMKANIVIDQEATEEARQKAREAVEPVIYLQGQNIVREGDRITSSQLEMIRSLGLLNDNHYDYSVYGGAAITTVLAFITLLMMLRLLMKDVLSDVRKLSVILITLLLCFGFASLATVLPSMYIVPIALGAILGTVLIGYRAGLVLTLPLAVLFAGITTVSSTTTFYDVVLIMSNTITCGAGAIWFLKGRPQRVRVLISGLIASIFCVATIIGIKMLTSSEAIDIMHTCIWSLSGSLLSGALAVAFQPVFEGIFHLATPSRLLEITNPNQPLMKRLMLEAPGTYHHSIIVANLAEAAADKIGANAYLARAGAYYHDIGKLKRPGYFSENQHGGNPHENTDPYVSAAIVTAHTRDGALIAQAEHLPPEVQDIILQHHGVTPVMFFYHKALQMADGNHVNIDDFRYTGPKPQTKEASIVMLADTIEAAVRSMKDPTPKAIDQFIERLIRGKLEDGQLSDCQLSLSDIDEICSAFSGILRGVYHERIAYPKVQQYTVQNTVKSEETQARAETASQPEKESADSVPGAKPSAEKAPDETAANAAAPAPEAKETVKPCAKEKKSAEPAPATMEEAAPAAEKENTAESTADTEKTPEPAPDKIQTAESVQAGKADEPAAPDKADTSAEVTEGHAD